jgi:hypothetical protein
MPPTISNTGWPWRGFFVRTRGRRGTGVAIVAVARKLAVLAWHLLTDDVDYRWAPAVRSADTPVRLILRRVGGNVASARIRRSVRGATTIPSRSASSSARCVWLTPAYVVVASSTSRPPLPIVEPIGRLPAAVAAGERRRTVAVAGEEAVDLTGGQPEDGGGLIDRQATVDDMLEHVGSMLGTPGGRAPSTMGRPTPGGTTTIARSPSASLTTIGAC